MTKRFIARTTIVASGLLGTVAAFAAPDVTAVTTAAADVATVGAAVFAVYVAVKGFKWIRAAL